MVIEAQTIQSSNWRRDHLAEHTKLQGNTQSSGLVLQPGNKQEGHKKTPTNILRCCHSIICIHLHQTIAKPIQVSMMRRKC
jgi:hypothetical protein